MSLFGNNGHWYQFRTWQFFYLLHILHISILKWRNKLTVPNTWHIHMLNLKQFAQMYNWFYRHKRSPGHLGCSSGFNSMLYKPYLPSGFNTQGREQCNSLLEKIRETFITKRQNSTVNFVYFTFYDKANIIMCGRDLFGLVSDWSKS